MALYIPHSIFHLARLLYVRPETFGPYYVPDFYPETLIYKYKTVRRHIPRHSVVSFTVLSFNPVRIEILCLNFIILMLVIWEIRVQISAPTPAITRLFIVFCISTA